MQLQTASRYPLVSAAKNIPGLIYIYIIEYIHVSNVDAIAHAYGPLGGLLLPWVKEG